MRIKSILRKLPWARNEQDIEDLQFDIKIIKQALIDARVANFVMVYPYDPAHGLVYKMPEPIKLEDLQRDVSLANENYMRFLTKYIPVGKDRAMTEEEAREYMERGDGS